MLCRIAELKNCLFGVSYHRCIYSRPQTFCTRDVKQMFLGSRTKKPAVVPVTVLLVALTRWSNLLPNSAIFRACRKSRLYDPLVTHGPYLSTSAIMLPHKALYKSPEYSYSFANGSRARETPQPIRSYENHASPCLWSSLRQPIESSPSSVRVTHASSSFSLPLFPPLFNPSVHRITNWTFEITTALLH